jgi:hypothetical protein
LNIELILAMKNYTRYLLNIEVSEYYNNRQQYFSIFPQNRYIYIVSLLDERMSQLI